MAPRKKTNDEVKKKTTTRTRKKKPIGAPSKFEQSKEALIEMAKLGLTDKQMAKVIGVTEVTLNNWKNKDELFFKSLKESKEISDHLVEKALFQRATGYSHNEDKIFNDNGVPLIVPTVKHYPPDTTAAIFWLKNRQPERWRDKQELEHSGQIASVKIVDDI